MKTITLCLLIGLVLALSHFQPTRSPAGTLDPTPSELQSRIEGLSGDVRRLRGQVEELEGKVRRLDRELDYHKTMGH